MRTCFILLLCPLTMSANKSLKKKNFPSGWKCYKRIGSYISCAFIEIWSTWEVWRTLEKLELLSATPPATPTHLSYSPNFLDVSYLDERTLTYEPIVKKAGIKFFQLLWIHFFVNPLTPKISLVILLTVCHINLVMLVQSIWYGINQ